MTESVRLTPNLKKLALRYAHLGFDIEVISKFLHVEETVLRRELRRNREFRENIYNAIAEARLFVLGKLYENIKKGDSRAIEYFMEHCFGKYWKNLKDDQPWNNENEPTVEEFFAELAAHTPTPYAIPRSDYPDPL
ncbi:MAG: hypothetical protein HUU32_22825 [Calditrichaceae bacterium]|nr:hypothetical protein [Calditrichia bacterium]NUQ44230.1 hypothetical protein [Calditrichaceae bacterium]